MNKKALYAVGTVMLLAFAGFSFSSFQQSLTPYVTFAEARDMDRTLQIAGGLVQGSGQYDPAAERLRFTLVEEETGDRMDVVYRGLKPGNFDDAVSIVAIGRFDPSDGAFAADKLLVKCPSKYQGLEGEHPEGVERPTS